MTGSSFYWFTEYKAIDNDGRTCSFASEVRATRETLDEIVKSRGLKERVVSGVAHVKPPETPSLAMRLRHDGPSLKALHQATFIGFLALKSGAATVEQIVGDLGLVHEIAHAVEVDAAMPGTRQNDYLVRIAEIIEAAIPGYALGH